MKRALLIGLGLVTTVVVIGAVLPILAKPSNCGGNSAALSACRNVCMAVRIVSSDRGTNFISLSGLRPEEARGFESIPGMRWLGSAHILVRTNGVLLGPSGPKEVTVVCDTAYSKVPQYRFLRAPATHAVGYSDGSVALISSAQYDALDLRAFLDIRRLTQKRGIDPAAGGNAE
jgi:hypothetical protein